MPQTTRHIIAKSLGMFLNILSYVHPKKSYSLAYTFFSNPRKGKLQKEKLPKLLQQAEQHSHSYNEHQFQTHTWKGNEDVVLLVHGWESNANRWRELMKQLRQTGKTIIAIDGPAHGLSDGSEFNVPTYAEFINVVAQKYKPSYIIGHSIGGTAAVYYQHLYPNHNLKKMVLLGAPCDFSIILQNYINILKLNSKIHNYLIGYTKERFDIVVDEFSASRFLINTTIPGLIVHDLEDDVVQFGEAKKMAASWKNAKLIETKGLGHSMHDFTLYQKIIEFLKD